jgi:hypothetical protein
MQLFLLETINNELESIMSNHTWELVKPNQLVVYGCLRKSLNQMI